MHTLQVYAEVKWCSKNKVGIVTKPKVDKSRGVFMGNPKAYGVVH
jgi:hypothetical protein